MTSEICSILSRNTNSTTTTTNINTTYNSDCTTGNMDDILDAIVDENDEVVSGITKEEQINNVHSKVSNNPPCSNSMTHLTVLNNSFQCPIEQSTLLKDTTHTTNDNYNEDDNNNNNSNVNISKNNICITNIPKTLTDCCHSYGFLLNSEHLKLEEREDSSVQSNVSMILSCKTTMIPSSSSSSSSSDTITTYTTSGLIDRTNLNDTDFIQQQYHHLMDQQQQQHPMETSNLNSQRSSKRGSKTSLNSMDMCNNSNIGGSSTSISSNNNSSSHNNNNDNNNIVNTNQKSRNLNTITNSNNSFSNNTNNSGKLF
ncbi:unnamed protein product [Schistosoma margrebowiei]|uniref:Uncharacterized protein n=1 Tax=Schistosoma margrebowiei TaxID=48269 RepID=A0A183LV67_9TREM|nr:unnamed protein product [Schistosoma margrebowiei]